MRTLPTTYPLLSESSQRATSADEDRREYDNYRDAADGSATLADLFQAKNNS